MFIQPLSEDSFSLWTFSHGNFILRVTKKILDEIKTIVKTINIHAVSSIAHLSFIFKFKLSSEIESAWSQGDITTEQAILVLNAKENRSFVDLSRYVVFPRIFKDINSGEYQTYGDDSKIEYPSKEFVRDSLKDILPFKYFATETVDHELFPYVDPAIIYNNPELHIKEGSPDYQKVLSLKHALESAAFEPHFLVWASKMFDFKPGASNKAQSDDEQKKFVSIGSTNARHMWQQLSFQDVGKFAFYYENDTLVKASLISIMLNCSKSTIISVNKEENRLRIYEIKSSQTLVEYYCPFLTHANGINVSENDLFMSIDYDFCATDVFRIIYKNKAPSSLERITRFSWSAEENGENLRHTKSAVSGNDFLCAISVKNVLTLWSFFTDRVYRRFDMDSNVLFVAFDESKYSFWCVTENKVQFITTNGILIAELNINDPNQPKHRITAFETVKVPLDIVTRCALCGTHRGSIIVVECDYERRTINKHSLNSPHKSEIVYISIHPSQKSFLSIDSAKNVYNWSGFNIGSPLMKQSLLLMCPFCSNKCSVLCELCNRVLCEDCIIDDKAGHFFCPNCFAYTNC
jgi:hypothetical protein